MKRITPSCLVTHRLKSSQLWINRHVKDHYVKLSSHNDLRSRSAYKLKEIQEKYKIITSPSNYVIDMGAAPGGWSLIAAEYLDHRGLLIAIDLLPIAALSSAKNNPNIHLLQGDMFSTSIADQIDIIAKSHFNHQSSISSENRSLPQLTDTASVSSATMAQAKSTTAITNTTSITSNYNLCDVILSDMMVNMCGNKETDHFRSMDLCFNAVDFSDRYLKPQGNFVCKYFRGKDDVELIQEARNKFESVKLVKPDASRQESSEMYLVCLKKKKGSGSRS